MIAVLLSLTAAAGYLGAAVIARHRAQAAADLGALAAAARADGRAAACAEASAVTQSMGARLRSCRLAELDVVVAVEVSVTLGRFGVGPAGATARAGPVSADR
ncbi:helicase [Mycolicibacterium flavescens]|nr:helicase [Mycolicibacterium flavescens]